MAYPIPRRFIVFLALFSCVSISVLAEGPFRNRDNKLRHDLGEPGYPIPYQLPTVDEVTEHLHRVRGFMEAAARTRVIDRKTKQPIQDLAQPVETAATDRGEFEFSPLAYEMGVVHAGMLKATEVTGDKRFTAFTQRHLQFIADHLPYFQAQEEKFKL